jgi:hypothetical protein
MKTWFVRAGCFYLRPDGEIARNVAEMSREGL